MQHHAFIGLFVVGLTFVACHKTLDSDYKNAAAANEIRTLQTALQMYKIHYGHFDLLTKDASNASIYGALTLLGNFGSVNPSNPDSIAFMDRRANRESRSHELLDPWGHAYIIMLDNSGGRVKVPERSPSTGPLIWSCGHNGLNEEGRGDDIASWDLKGDEPDGAHVILNEIRQKAKSGK